MLAPIPKKHQPRGRGSRQERFRQSQHEREQRHNSGQQERDKGGHRSRDRIWLGRRQAVFAGQHQGDPFLRFRGYRAHRTFQHLTAQSQVLKDLPQLLALSLRVLADMALFYGVETPTLVQIRFGTQIIGRRHGKPVSQYICDPERDYHRGGKPSPLDARCNGKGGHRAVYPAIDRVPQPPAAIAFS